MDDIKPGMYYIAADGDGIGKLVGRAVIANDVDALHKVSNRIDAAQDLILHWCKENGGIKISGGGDEFTAAIPAEANDELQKLRASVESSFGYTISVGVGRNLSEAGTALLVAKLRGKNRIVYFNKKIKEDIKKAKRRVRENRASQEEYKLSEAYLEKSENMLCKDHKSKMCDLHKSEEGKHAPHTEPGTDDPCPYCADNEDARTDDCAYCQDLDAEENADGTAGMHDCPYCQDATAQEQNVGGIDDCPYCQTENITQGQANPVRGGDHICNCPNCPSGKNDQTDMAVKDMGAQHPDNCPECQEMYGQAVENQPGQTGGEDPNMQGHETAEQVLGLLDQEPNGKSPTPQQEAKQIDNTELPQGDQMRENTSVKDSFGQAQKNDVSDADKVSGSGQPGAVAPGQDEPDMAGVVQSGLDEHADEQQKQKVLDMVSQTLQGFKANKASLEATKEQNQPLYNSCIQMLKSMIELCKLLGLQPQMAAPATDDQGLAQEAQADPSMNAPKQQGPADPATPPQTAAPAEGAAGVPKTPR